MKLYVRVLGAEFCAEGNPEAVVDAFYEFLAEAWICAATRKESPRG